MLKDYDGNFLKIFHNNLVGMILTNEDHIIVDINDHLLQLAELERKDVIGKTGIELGILDDDFIKGIWEEFTQKEQLLNRELLFKTKNNKPVNCLFSTERIEFDNNKYWLTTIVDISIRKKNEEKIAESELRFRTLTKTAPVGIFETDAKGATTFVNDVWLQYSGMKFEEAMGDGWLDAVHPEDREWLAKGWHSKTKIKAESFSEYRIIDKQGRLRWVNGKAVPVFNTDGLITGYIGIILDVTERKIAEQRITESEESKRFILNSALDAVIIIDSESNISFWNPQAEKMFGWTAAEVIGSNLTETIIPTEFAASHKKGMQHYLETGEGPIMNRLIEITAMNKTGAAFPVELSIIPVSQEKGKSFCAFIRDISGRKKAELSLKETTEQLRELSSHLQNIREEERMNIAREIHDELGQQLTGLKMDIAWLMKKSALDDVVVKNKFNDVLLLVDATVRSIRRIATELRPSVIDDLGLNAAFEWLISEFSDRMQIEIKYENNFNDKNLDPDTSIGLFRILQESLNNIAKHANAGKAEITIEKVNGEVHLTVQDNGIGFDAATKQSSLNFGLLGIRERVNMMRGGCNVFSKPGQGTKIEVSIPLD